MALILRVSIEFCLVTASSKPSSEELKLRETDIIQSAVRDINSSAMRKSWSAATPWKPPIRCEFPTDFVPADMKKAMVVTSLALLGGGRLQPIDEGMGGSYACRDRKGLPVAIFKPRDEEPCAPNNPKNLQGNFGDMSIKKGIRSGEQALREVAAYVLDRGMARVPTTIMASVDMSKDNSKVGSLQSWVAAKCTCGDMGPGRFDTRDVHAIAALDLRLLNTDRHDGNILVQAQEDDALRLVPIDHGCCLPDSLDVCWYEWTWLNWPQMSLPIVPAVRDNILALDIDADAAVLSEMRIRPECIRTMRMSSRFLQLCVRFREDLTLGQIASWMCRAEDESPSTLEGLVARARWKAAAMAIRTEAHVDETFPRCFDRAIRSFLAKH